MDLIGRILLLLVAVGVAAAASWFLHTRAWPDSVVVGLDIVIWVTLGSSLVGLFRDSAPTDREILDRLRTRTRREDK